MGVLDDHAEDEREDEGEDERLQHRPADAEEALLVADLELALGEEVDELAVLPELAEVNRLETGRGRDRRFLLRRWSPPREDSSAER